MPLTIVCEKCGHRVEALMIHKKLREALGTEPGESLGAALVGRKSDLKCSNCGAKDAYLLSEADAVKSSQGWDGHRGVSRTRWGENR